MTEFYDLAEDKMKEECGVLGIFCPERPVTFLSVYLGLLSLQQGSGVPVSVLIRKF